MCNINSISQLYQKDTRCADALLKPQRWCHREWENLTSSLGKGCEGCKELAKRIALFIPLIFITLIAYLTGLVGISIKACTAIEKKAELPPPNPKQQKTDLFHLTLSPSDLEKIKKNFKISVDTKILVGQEFLLSGQTHPKYFLNDRTIYLNCPSTHVLTPFYRTFGIEDSEKNKYAILTATAWKKDTTHLENTGIDFLIAVSAPVPVTDFNAPTLQKAIHSDYFNTWWHAQIFLGMGRGYIYELPKKVKEMFPAFTGGAMQDQSFNLTIDRQTGNFYLPIENLRLHFAIPGGFEPTDVTGKKEKQDNYGFYEITYREFRNSKTNETIMIIADHPTPLRYYIPPILTAYS